MYEILFIRKYKRLKYVLTDFQLFKQIGFPKFPILLMPCMKTKWKSIIV